MITDVERWAPGYAELGAFSVTFHAEATEDPVALARRIRSIGARAGLALKPGTRIDPYLELLPEFDQLLVMTVEPGFGGQSFMTSTLPKLRAAREVIDREQLSVWLQVDGGITESTDRDRRGGRRRHVRRRFERVRHRRSRARPSPRCAPSQTDSHRH